MNSFFTSFKSLIIAVTFLLLVPMSASAQEVSLELIQSLSNRVTADIEVINNITASVDNADLSNESDVEMLIDELDASINSLEGSVSFYQSFYTPNIELSIINAALEAGTANTNEGLKSLQLGLINQDQTQWDEGLDAANSGIDELNLAQTKLNNYIDQYNATARASNQEAAAAGATSTSEPVVDSETSDVLYGLNILLGIILLIIFGYLFIAAFILNASFRLKLAKVITHQTDKIKNSFIYGLHLILLLPLLYFLLLISVFLVLEFGIVGLVFITQAERIPIAILIGIPFVVLASLWAILKGFFAKTKSDVFGIEITPEEQPDIWKLCNKVASDVGTQGVDKIYITPNPGIGVFQTGGLFSLLFGRTKRVLSLGIGSMTNLTVSEFEAILGHEFGHFSNKDTSWNSLTYSMATSLENTYATIPKPWGNESGGWITLLSALNPALWLILVYRFLFGYLTKGFSRMREVLADKTAIGLYGFESFENGLTKVARNDYLFSNIFVPKIIEQLHQEHLTYKNVFSLMDEVVKKNEDTNIDLDKQIREEQKYSSFDSHPLLRERFAYGKGFQKGSTQAVNKGLVNSLFKDYGLLSEKLTDMYSYYLAILTGYQFNEPEAQQAATQ